MSDECLDADLSEIDLGPPAHGDHVHEFPTRVRSRVAIRACIGLAVRRIARRLGVRLGLCKPAPLPPERAVVQQMLRDQGMRHAEPWHFERPSRLRRMGR